MLELADPRCPIHLNEASCICLDPDCPNCPIRVCMVCLISENHTSASLISQLDSEVGALVDGLVNDEEIR